MSSPIYLRRRSALAGPQRSDLELPPYSPPQAPHPSSNRDPIEHIYHLGNSKPWATLKLLSRASSSKQLPTFNQHESILGSLELNLEKGDTILTVNVSVSNHLLLTHPAFSLY
jgi:hypothetical protein